LEKTGKNSLAGNAWKNWATAWRKLGKTAWRQRLEETGQQLRENLAAAWRKIGSNLEKNMLEHWNGFGT
jgi:hypothetical protein